jgi:glutamate decarboxylase
MRSTALAKHSSNTRQQLIDAVKALILPFIRAADEAVPSRAAGELLPNKEGVVQNALVNARKPEDLVRELSLCLPEGPGLGEDGLLRAIGDILKYSVNTWDQGFMDKLYASTNPVRPTSCQPHPPADLPILTLIVLSQVGVVSELLLGVLNTNVSGCLPLGRVPVPPW